MITKGARSMTSYQPISNSKTSSTAYATRITYANSPSSKKNSGSDGQRKCRACCSRQKTSLKKKRKKADARAKRLSRKYEKTTAES